MDVKNSSNAPPLVLVGDIVVISIAVLIGFFIHGEMDLVTQRIGYTVIPWLVGWLVAAKPLGLFDAEILANRKKSVLHIIWAMALASPLAALLRAAWLGSSAVPVFALVLGLVAAVAAGLWQIIYSFLIARLGPVDG